MDTDAQEGMTKDDFVDEEVAHLRKQFDEALERVSAERVMGRPGADRDQTVISAGRLVRAEAAWKPVRLSEVRLALEAFDELGFAPETRARVVEEARRISVGVVDSVEPAANACGRCLDDADLSYGDGSFRMGPDLVFTFSSLVEPCLKHPFGLWHLRGNVRHGREAFDRKIRETWDVLGAHVRESLELFRGNVHCGSLDLASYLEAFPPLDKDPAWLGAALSELGRRGNVTKGFHRGWRETDLLEIARRSRAWSPETAIAFVGLEDVAGRQPALFGKCCRAAIWSLWLSERGVAGYVALTWLRHLRLARLASSQMDDLEAERSAGGFLASLVDSDAVRWMNEKLEEAPAGHPGERVAWRYLSDAAKGRWRYLVRSRLACDAAACESFIRYATQWLPASPYDDVERLVIDLCDDSVSWPLMERLSESGPTISKLRSGALLDRRALGRLDHHGVGPERRRSSP